MERTCTCPTCGGLGSIVAGTPKDPFVICPECNGDGQVKEIVEDDVSAEESR